MHRILHPASGTITCCPIIRDHGGLARRWAPIPSPRTRGLLLFADRELLVLGGRILGSFVPASDEARTIQIARVLPQMTRGHPDLELSMHDSAFESVHWTYRFDGRRYRKVKCVRLSYQDAKDLDRTLSEPRIVPC